MDRVVNMRTWGRHGGQVRLAYHLRLQSRVRRGLTRYPSVVSASPPPTDGLSLRERKRLRTADAIYDAALELLAERPYDNVTVDDICERAEVGRATFFRFYGTKVGLLEEFNRRLTADAAAAVEASGKVSAADRLKVVQEVVAKTWTRSGPGMQRIASEVARAGVPAAERSLYPDLVRLVGAIVAEGIESGEFEDRGRSEEHTSE